ncbi:MAG: hypothetical protein Fur0010_26850 [Bdellovibrio sp.]
MGREIYGKLTEQDRKTLSEQFKIPPEQLEAAIIKDLQQKTASTFVGNMPLSMMLEDLGLQAISALETNNEKDALAITDFITHVQDRNKLGRRFSDFPSRETSPTEVNITELLAPEREMVEGRSLFSDYAVNGERRDQTALEELAPVLAERDRNTIGVSSPIEIPYQRRMVPAPPSSDFPPPTETLPIGRTPTDEPSVLADRPTSGSGKGVSKSGGLTSAASELSSLSTSKEPVSTVVREETRPSVETPRDRKPDTSEKDSLNDAIARANKSLDDYKKAIAAAGPNPEDNPDVQRLRRELDAARAAVEDSKNNLAAIRNARNNGGAVSNNIPVASNDWQTAAGNGGRVLSDPFDPVSSATALPTRGATIDPGVQGGATSAMSAAGGGKMSSESVAGGMSVAPRGTLSAAQARQSLKDKGIISDDTPLPFEFQNPIAQALLFEDYPNIDESRVLSMLSMLGLEGMDFKTIETVGENASEHIVRFFGIDTVAFHGRFDPLRRCEKPMEDLKSRMKMFEDIKRLRAQSKKEMLAMISKQICLTQEKRVGYDEYQRLVDVLLNQDRMLERIYAVTREKSRSLNRGPASEN